MEDFTVPEKYNQNIARLNHGDDEGLGYSRDHLIMAFGAGVMVGLLFAVSRKVRDIASLVSVGARIYSNFSHNKRGR